MCGGQRWKNYWSLSSALDVCVERKPCVLLQRLFITLTAEAKMYCAYTVPGMGSNSLMYYYNGKSVSTLSGHARVRHRSAGKSVSSCATQSPAQSARPPECPSVSFSTGIFLNGAHVLV